MAPTTTRPPPPPPSPSPTPPALARTETPTPQRAEPWLPWTVASALTMGVVGSLSRVFLYGANRTEVEGLQPFLRILDERSDVNSRERGLITVSNHISVMDEPLLWGILPTKYLFSPHAMRWSLGAADICFNNTPVATFFTLGQVLPTHRLAYSSHGGLFQPTMTQAIRLLSRGPFPVDSLPSPSSSSTTTATPRTGISIIDDPFSSNQLSYPSSSSSSSSSSSTGLSTTQKQYSTTGQDAYPLPTRYTSTRAHSWLHVFPEGKVHQHESRTMRYFKWGVARLLLEAEPIPRLVPIWIEGFNDVMDETRSFPRWIPRPARRIHVLIGDEVDAEERFGDLRARWRQLVRETESKSNTVPSPRSLEGKKATTTIEVTEEEATETEAALGVLNDEGLKYGDIATALRIECTKRVRDEVLRLRNARGWPPEDPKAGLVDTWLQEGQGRQGRMLDGSWLRDV
ncbi:MAG: hypothetical protein M1825_001483 [Sarcosagium campestre]|nr:MAG: hypothetical protein M1825_001483 [Sarcosagium campestre]